MMASQLCSPPEANGEPKTTVGGGERDHNLRIPEYKEEKEPTLELKALTGQHFFNRKAEPVDACQIPAR